MRLKLTLQGSEVLAAGLQAVANRLGNMRPAIQASGRYMVGEVQGRIIQTKRAPDGTPWAPLTQATLDLRRRIRGDTSADQLMVTGALDNSVKVTKLDGKSVTIAAEADHAKYQQRGVRRTRGLIKEKTVPARPFMGFSDQNLRDISNILKDYILTGTTRRR